MELENIVMELIIQSGEAHSHSMQALRCARQQKWDDAERLLAAATALIRDAHHIQTSLIGKDEGCGKIPVNLILVHAQDHLMNAMLCRELAEEILYLHRELAAIKNAK